jgi:thiol-disulfide isomerase/thioredoxin
MFAYTRSLWIRSASLCSLAAIVFAGCDSLKPKPADPPHASASPTASQDPLGAAATETPPTIAESDAPLGSETSGSAADDGNAASSVDNSTAMPASEMPISDIPVLVDPSTFQQQLLNGLDEFDNMAPDALIAHIQKVDVSIKDLMTASANNAINERTFIESGLALGRFKLESAKALAELPGATPEQRKAGQLAQLVALSHLSGFRDVESAQQLEKYASELAQSPDTDLAHQSRVVLMGFQIQALQNGISADPNELLMQAEGLFQRPEDRNFPELMILLQSNQVLTQMGFADAAKRMNEIIVEEYSDSQDPQLRSEAWNIQTRGSQALENYLMAFRSLGTAAFDQVAAIQAARGLFTDFPSIQTLEQLTSTVTDIEYGGQLDLSNQLVDLIKQGLRQLPEGTSTDAIDMVIAKHDLRVGLIGKQFAIEGLVRFDQQEFAWEDYRGKVLLVDFWATWCGPCLREIPTIRKTYESLHTDGFDVVSINMDEDLAQAEDFVAKQNFPWATFRSDDPDALGFGSTFAQELGVNAIPFMLLVDRDGNVAAIHVRGERLAPAVRDLMGLPNSLIPE